jgi:hypothetical protein
MLIIDRRCSYYSRRLFHNNDNASSSLVEVEIRIIQQNQVLAAGNLVPQHIPILGVHVVDDMVNLFLFNSMHAQIARGKGVEVKKERSFCRGVVLDSKSRREAKRGHPRTGRER